MRRWVLPTSKSPSYSTTLTLSSLLTPLRMVQSPPRQLALGFFLGGISKHIPFRRQGSQDPPHLCR